jgi:hypothetical protein
MTFIFYTIFCLIGTASLLKVLHIAIQPTQIFGWWGEKLMQWEREGKLFLSKAGGMCELCYSFWFGLILLPVYVLLVELPFAWWGNILWCVLYHFISTCLTLYFLTRLYDSSRTPE